MNARRGVFIEYHKNAGVGTHLGNKAESMLVLVFRTAPWPGCGCKAFHFAIGVVGRVDARLLFDPLLLASPLEGGRRFGGIRLKGIVRREPNILWVVERVSVLEAVSCHVESLLTSHSWRGVSCALLCRLTRQTRTLAVLHVKGNLTCKIKIATWGQSGLRALWCWWPHHQGPWVRPLRRFDLETPFQWTIFARTWLHSLCSQKCLLAVWKEEYKAK